MSRLFTTTTSNKSGILSFNPLVTSAGLVEIKSTLLNTSLKSDTPNLKAKINETGPPIINVELIALNKMVTKPFGRV